MRKTSSKICSAALLTAALLALAAVPALAGGFLDTIDVTGNVPSPVPGLIEARIVSIHWDPRCQPVHFRVNNTLDPIPNPLGTPFLHVADVLPVYQKSLDVWNAVPTSFLKMDVVGTVANPGLPGLDFVNEITFRTSGGFNLIAVTIPTTLNADTTFNVGDDIDGDGIPDVVAGITTCTEINGHIKFPPGLYTAGTILDADIQFNTSTANGTRFTINDSDIDTNPRSADLMAIAVHEFGHAHGLSHVINNNNSKTDGTASTMFPFLDTSDPASELAQRHLAEDDIAWVSFLYPAGRAASGPAALRPGQIPFDAVYGVLKGDVTHSDLGLPLVGASVNVYDFANPDRWITSGFSGHVTIAADPATGNLFLLGPQHDLVDGKFQVPVRLGLYSLGIKALDGLPVTAGRVNFATQISDIYNEQSFNEKLWGGPFDSASSDATGLPFPAFVFPGQKTDGIHIFTRKSQSDLHDFGQQNFVGFTGVPAGSYYAVRFPNTEIAAVNPKGGVLVQQGNFLTFVPNSSVVPLFSQAMLTTGTLDASGNATIDLQHPLEQRSPFLAKDSAFAPLFVTLPRLVGALLNLGTQIGQPKDLFLVLRLPTTTPFPGIQGLPPFIGLNGGVATPDVPITGNSFFSTDGKTWTQLNNFNFMFQLTVAPAS